MGKRKTDHMKCSEGPPMRKLYWLAAGNKEDIPGNAFTYASYEEMVAEVANDLELGPGEHFFISQVEVLNMQEGEIVTAIRTISDAEE